MDSPNKLNINVAIIVAHLSDETLWTGGTIINHPRWKWNVLAIFKESDSEYEKNFYHACKLLRAEGTIGDLHENNEHNQSDEATIQQTILSMLPQQKFDLIITHSPYVEYTLHKQHKLIGNAVRKLIQKGFISTRHLWTFYSEAGQNQYIPQEIENAYFIYKLPKDIWEKKYEIITRVYSSDKKRLSARNIPRKETYCCFNTPAETCHML